MIGRLGVCETDWRTNMEMTDKEMYQREVDVDMLTP